METAGVKYKYSVVTYIFGDYEVVHEIGCELEDDVEYILVTDNKKLKSKTWTIVIDEELNEKTVFDKVFSVRYNLFKYCHSDVCFRIDGSIEILKSLTPIVEEFLASGNDIGISAHIYRNNVVEELAIWNSFRDYPMSSVRKQINFFRNIGFEPTRKGLVQMNFAINKRGKITDDIDRMMYAILHYLGDENGPDRLDQTVFSVVIDKFFPHVKCKVYSEYLLHTDYLAWHHHGKNKRIPVMEHLTKPPYFRNELVSLA